MSFKNHMKISQCQLPVISAVYILAQSKQCLIQKNKVIIFSSLEHEICCKNFFPLSCMLFYYTTMLTQNISLLYFQWYSFMMHT